MVGTVGNMHETSTRLLRLLSLLQSRRGWSGPALAERLNVSARTVRTDVDRLRSLGYDVAAVPGVGGGYRLRTGTAVPPLFLEAEEAVAVAVGLRTAATTRVAGIGSHAVGALAKLEQVLPTALKQQVQALQAAIVANPDTAGEVDADTLALLAAACRDGRHVRMRYRDHAAALTTRTIEPLRLVLSDLRWYLIAWDIDRAGWRTFRVDRIEAPQCDGSTFEPRDPPAGDLAEYVAARAGSAMWRYRARLRLSAPAAVIAARVPPAVRVEEAGEQACIASVGSDSLEMLCLYIGMLGADFVVLEPPELVPHLARLAERYGRAVRQSEPGSTAAVPR